MVGARLTGATPGQALAIAGQQYLNRIDAQAANDTKLHNDLIKNGKYNLESVKAFMDSGDPSDLVPVAAQRIGTGEFKEFYSPTGQRVNAQKFKVGEGQYVWVGENGKQINSKYNSDPARVPGTPEYKEMIFKDSKTYTDMLKGLRTSAAVKQDKYGNVEYATGIEPTVAGNEIARWAVENEVDPTLMGELIQNAHAAAAADSQGKKVKSLKPYLNDLYVKATVGDPNLFKTKGGGDMKPADYGPMFLSLIHISEPTRPY